MAKTTVTKFCSPVCSKKGYKHKIKNEKIAVSNIETKKIIDKPIEDLKSREFMTVRQVAKLLCSSRVTVHNLINSGRLQAVKLGERTTRISRANIDRLFQQDFIPMVNTLEPKTKPLKFVSSEWYGLTEILEKFSISDSTLRIIARRENIEKHRNGKFIFYRKKQIDSIFNSSTINNV